VSGTTPPRRTTDPEPDRDKPARDGGARRDSVSSGVHAKALLYLGAQKLLESGATDGAMTGAIAHNLGLASDPRVDREAERIEHERTERAIVRSKARTYLRAQETLENDRYGGALNGSIAYSLGLADDPEVRRTANRIARERDLRERRAAERAATEAKAELYLRTRHHLATDRYGGAMSQTIAHNLALARDPDVRQAVARIVRERREQRLERLYGPLQGPELTDGTIGLALPWPGSSVTTTFDCSRRIAPAKASSCVLPLPKGKSRGSIGISAEVSETAARGEPVLREDGRRYESLSLSTDMRLTGSGEVDLPRGVEATLKKFVGRETSYKVVVSSGRADRIASGTGSAPNPLDPRSLGEGEGIELTRETYSGNGQEVSYRLLQVKLGYSKGHEISSGVQRVGPNRVRIYVGDQQVVENALRLGVGTDQIGIAVGLSDEFKRGALRTAEMNLSSRGGWEAYQRFVTGGRLPRPDRGGVVDSASVDSASWSRTQSFELRLGPLKAGGTSTPSEGQVTETRYVDGRVERALTDRIGEVTLLRSTERSRPGAPWRGKRYSLLLQGADHNWVEGMLQLRGDERELSGDQDLMLDFSAGDLTAIRQQALRQLSRQTKVGGEEGLSPAEVDRIMWGDPYATLPAATPSPFAIHVAAARNPHEVLLAMHNMARGNPTQVLDQLLHFQIRPAGPNGGPALSPAKNPDPDLPGRITLFAPRR
jgi:hypothetical protein